ncbi:MAG: winged helix-turn-helix transcriptional regulator [candidate division Zixibacteria bacterium]|nr:winged helix-turn-helix transcriptional regulator [candidate division Zixibacteria bacterium]
MEERIYSKYFKAFGEPTRIRILRMLSDKEMTVGHIVKKVGLSQPTVSRHLAILREAGIVTDRRDGQQVFYSLNKGTVQECCSGFCDCLEIKHTQSKKSRKN